MSRVPFQVKLGCWFMLGCWSAGLAEVVSGASPFVFASPWGLLITVPLYLLHAIVLVTVVHWLSGRLTFGSLYLAGALFGLYEAYLTKVIWTPTWEPIPVQLAGIYPFETGLLVLLWHPLMAFVAPILLTETTATRSRLAVAGLPHRVRRLLATRPLATVGSGLAAMALVQGALSTDPATTLVGNLLAIGVLAGTIGTWRRRVGVATYSFPELLPDRRELAGLGLLLAGLYVGLGAFLRPEVLPGFGAQATVWILYLGFGGLLVLRLRRDRMLGESPSPPGVSVPGRAMMAAGVAFLVLAGLASVVLSPVALLVFVGMYGSSVVLGGYLLITIGRSVVVPRAKA